MAERSSQSRGEKCAEQEYQQRDYREREHSPVRDLLERLHICSQWRRQKQVDLGIS